MPAPRAEVVPERKDQAALNRPDRIVVGQRKLERWDRLLHVADDDAAIVADPQRARGAVVEGKVERQHDFGRAVVGGIERDAVALADVDEAILARLCGITGGLVLRGPSGLVHTGVRLHDRRAVELEALATSERVRHQREDRAVDTVGQRVEFQRRPGGVGDGVAVVDRVADGHLQRVGAATRRRVPIVGRETHTELNAGIAGRAGFHAESHARCLRCSDRAADSWRPASCGDGEGMAASAPAAPASSVPAATSRAAILVVDVFISEPLSKHEESRGPMQPRADRHGRHGTKRLTRS